MTFVLSKLPLALAALAIGSAGGAAKPAPTPTTFVPEIAYTYAQSKGVDLRLSNLQGTAAVLVHRTSGAPIGHVDLSPRHVRKIAYAVGGGVEYRVWSSTATGVSVSAPATVHTATPDQSLGGFDFSPDGGRLALALYSEDPAKRCIRIFDFDPGTADPCLATSDYPLAVRWDSSGANLLFIMASPANVIGSVYWMPADGSASPRKLVDLMSGQNSIETLRANSESSSTQFVLSGDSKFARWQFEPAEGTAQSLGNFLRAGSDVLGYLPHFSSDNSKILHRIYDRRRRDTGIYDVATQAVTLWSSDGNVGQTDWMP